MISAALLLATATAASGPADVVVIGQPLLTERRRIVPDAELAIMRGGLALPNGLSVAIGIDIQTRIDGVLALHTIYSSDGPNAGIRVYTDGVTSPRTAPATATVMTVGTASLPIITIDRSPSGTTILPAVTTPAATVNLVSGDPSTWLTAAGQTPVPVVENGPAVAAAPGAISLRNDGSGAVVTLDAPMLQVRQLIGQATGAVIANTGNDRSIDTISSVNVDLQGLSPTLMGAIFAVQRIVTDAATR